MTTDVVFIHGAGPGAYDADAKLARSLAQHLGDDFAVRMPRLPDDDGTDGGNMLRAIGEAIGRPAEPVVLVGHSAGGYLLVKHLAGEPVHPPVAAICLIAAPFPGADPDWTFDGFDLPDDLADRLPSTAPVFLYASPDDDVVPFTHRDSYAAAIPGAVARTTAGGHQLADDLEVVARDIRSLPRSVDRR